MSSLDNWCGRGCADLPGRPRWRISETGVGAGNIVSARIWLITFWLIGLAGGCTMTPETPAEPPVETPEPFEAPAPESCTGDFSALSEPAAAICQRFNRVLESVDFLTGKSMLDLASRKALDELVADLNTFPNFIVRIEAHTDNRGSARANLALSKDRALAVVRYLVVNGVDGRRLQPFGFGEARPRVSNDTEAGRQQNRRIEVRVVVPVDET